MTNTEIRNHPKFYNVFISGPKERLKLYTINSDPGNRVYGEKLISYRGIEYREWDPYRSKLAALLLGNPISNFFTEGLNCLYLGASSGTTISHLSDILTKGIIYGVEFAERSIRQLIQNISRRVNIIPILADARDPTNYAKSVFTNIDLIYQDISQPNQAEIAVNNCNYYLKDTGLLILVIKSQSIDSVQKSEVIYEQEKVVLEKSGYSVLESVNIHKYAANHIILIVKRKST
ncbi:MAG: fibrillarin-like rRNA/tRNA 2'-O-methyltransferase [Candidatus Thorarchaeota archaeon]